MYKHAQTKLPLDQSKLFRIPCSTNRPYLFIYFLINYSGFCLVDIEQIYVLLAYVYMYNFTYILIFPQIPHFICVPEFFDFSTKSEI